ncbi:MAG: hypothetical protein IPO21_18770 [Bacteroidales bacterium]|nr:hypothetical protein [Bacteroidales bacterium]
MRIFKTGIIVLLTVFASSIALAQDVKNASGYVQIFDVRSKLDTNNRQQYYYENDLLKITYLFWGEKGKMKVSIENKSDKPLYIDWAKSFYQINDDKLSYSPEENITEENKKVYMRYLANNPTLTSMDYEMNSYSATGTLYDTKVEGVTKIDKTSTYTRSKYHIVPGDVYKFDVATVPRSEARNDEAGGMADVYEVSFDAANSPITFQSVIMYSVNESFTDEQQLAHEFYVSKITETDAKHFRAPKIGKTMEGYPIYKFPFRKSTKFYVEMDKKYSIKERK